MCDHRPIRRGRPSSAPRTLLPGLSAIACHPQRATPREGAVASHHTTARQEFFAPAHIVEHPQPPPHNTIHPLSTRPLLPPWVRPRPAARPPLPSHGFILAYLALGNAAARRRRLRAQVAGHGSAAMMMTRDRRREPRLGAPLPPRRWHRWWPRGRRPGAGWIPRAIGPSLLRC